MRNYVLAVVLLIGIVTAVSGGDRWRSRQEGPCLPPCESPYAPTAPAPQPGTPPPPDIAQAPSSAFSEALASAGEGGTQPAASYAPGFFGDLLGGCVLSHGSIIVPGEGGPFRQDITVCVPDVALASALKISDSDSPRPVDRIYYLHHFY